MVAFSLFVMKATPRASRRFVIVAATVLLAIGPARGVLQSAADQVSAAKGTDYLSAASLSDRFMLAIASWEAFKDSAVLGIGQSALTPFVFTTLTQGTSGLTDFVYQVNDEFENNLTTRQFDSHNLWVSLATESGVAGMVVFAGFLLLGWRIVREWRAGRTSAILASLAWLGTVAGYIAQAEPYILSLVTLVAFLALANERPSPSRLDRAP
jgi:O-antigen ligase